MNNIFEIQNVTNFSLNNCLFRNFSITLKSHATDTTFENLEMENSHLVIGDFIGQEFQSKSIDRPSVISNLILRNVSIWNSGFDLTPTSIDHVYSYSLENISVNGKEIFYMVDKFDMTIKSTHGQFFLINCTNITFQDCEFDDTSDGLFVYYSNSIHVVNNSFGNANVRFADSQSINIKNNLFQKRDPVWYFHNLMVKSGSDIRIENNSLTLGIRLGYITNSTIRNNVMVGDCGLWLSEGDQVTIHNNRLGEKGIYFWWWNIDPMTEVPIINFNVTNNSVNGKPIYYFQHNTTIVLPEDSVQIILINCSMIEGSNLSLIEGNKTGLFCLGVIDLRIDNSSISHSRMNNAILGSERLQIENCTFISADISIKYSNEIMIRSSIFLDSTLDIRYGQVILKNCTFESFGEWTSGNVYTSVFCMNSDLRVFGTSITNYPYGIRSLDGSVYVESSTFLNISSVVTE